MQPSVLEFFSSKLEESNELLTPSQKKTQLTKNLLYDVAAKVIRTPRKIARLIKRIVKS